MQPVITSAPAAKPQPIFDDAAWVGNAGAFLAYVYLLRVPLLICVALAALPLVAVPHNAVAGPLLRGLFDIVDPDPAFGSTVVTFGLLTLAALFVAITVAITARLILLDGHRRFEVRELPKSAGVQVLVRLVPLVAAASCTAGAWVQTRPSLKTLGVLAALTGTCLAIALCWFLMTVVHDRLWAAIFQRKASRLTSNRVIKAFASIFVVPFRSMISLSPEGFVRSDGDVLPRHMFALLQFIVSILFYVVLFLLKSQWIARQLPLLTLNVLKHPGVPPRIPTLCLVFVLAMLAAWGLSGLTFFFDRFRVPLLTVLVAWGTAMSIFPWNDHFFQTIDGTQHPTAMPPGSVVLRQHEYEPAIVVTAAGGGIQAAAWTARVLSQIAQDSLKCETDFARSLMAISGVSGGSVGAMYFVDAYGQAGQLSRPRLLQAEAAAELSSLDEVAWGLTYPDLVWGLAPFLKGLNKNFLVKDRGSALEDSWKRTPSLGTATLNGWRTDLSYSHRPAVMFNATVTETGERMIFGTTTFDPRPNFSQVLGRREFGIQYPNLDVPITTAVRMSATFPYVSPAARVNDKAGLDDQYHYVDGGYYDNYGTATMIDWLDSGLRAGVDHSPSTILMIEIRSFPDEQLKPEASHGGWFADLLQPLKTLYYVRGAGQLAHSELSGDLMSEDWQFSRLSIAFPRQQRDDLEPPLSWHLTPADRLAIMQAWEAPAVKKQRIAIQMFLGASEDDANSCLNKPL